MSDKLIKASDAVDIVAKHSSLYGDGEINTDDGEALLYDIMSEIMNLPSAQPERKTGKWIATTSLQEGQITWKDYKCSKCSHHREKPMNFCEVCGAKMER